MTTRTRVSAQDVIDSIRHVLVDTRDIVPRILALAASQTGGDAVLLADTIRIVTEVIDHAEKQIPKRAVSDQDRAEARLLGTEFLLQSSTDRR